MAKIAEINQDALNEWLSTRPQMIQDMCAKYPPDRLYRMKDTGQRVTLYSYSEDGTVTVTVSGTYNLIATFERNVFGVDPSSLEECDLPSKDEVLGVLVATVIEI